MLPRCQKSGDTTLDICTLYIYYMHQFHPLLFSGVSHTYHTWNIQGTDRMRAVNKKFSSRLPHREGQDLCPACHGSGRIGDGSTSARARRGGNASFLVSLNPERLSMSERGRLGGRPKELTLDALRLQQAQSGGMGLPRSLQEMAPERLRKPYPGALRPRNLSERAT